MQNTNKKKRDCTIGDKKLGEKVEGRWKILKNPILDSIEFLLLFFPPLNFSSIDAFVFVPFIGRFVRLPL